MDEFERSTAPQSAYTRKQVGIGFVVLLIGVGLIALLALVV